jgi:hypothetical protein
VLRTGDADRVIVDTDGKVHVVGSDKSSDAGIAISQKDGVNALLQVSAAGACIGTTSSHPLVLKTGNADQVSIDKDGTFTAKSTHITGQLSVTGPVSMFGSYQGRQVNANYVAATDGIVCSLITGAKGDDSSSVLLDGMVNGQRIGQVSGFHVTFGGDLSGQPDFPSPQGRQLGGKTHGRS